VEARAAGLEDSRSMFGAHEREFRAMFQELKESIVGMAEGGDAAPVVHFVLGWVHGWVCRLVCASPMVVVVPLHGSPPSPHVYAAPPPSRAWPCSSGCQGR
jgi:hypothetical protein